MRQSLVATRKMEALLVADFLKTLYSIMYLKGNVLSP